MAPGFMHIHYDHAPRACASSPPTICSPASHCIAPHLPLASLSGWTSVSLYTRTLVSSSRAPWERERDYNDGCRFGSAPPVHGYYPPPLPPPHVPPHRIASPSSHARTHASHIYSSHAISRIYPPHRSRPTITPHVVLVLRLKTISKGLATAKNSLFIEDYTHVNVTDCPRVLFWLRRFVLGRVFLLLSCTLLRSLAQNGIQTRNVIIFLSPHVPRCATASCSDGTGAWLRPFLHGDNHTLSQRYAFKVRTTYLLSVLVCCRAMAQHDRHRLPLLPDSSSTPTPTPTPRGLELGPPSRTEPEPENQHRPPRTRPPLASAGRPKGGLIRSQRNGLGNRQRERGAIRGCFSLPTSSRARWRGALLDQGVGALGKPRRWRCGYARGMAGRLFHAAMIIDAAAANFFSGGICFRRLQACLPPHQARRC
ncbi:hypothetical protein C8T65DRAFT_31471 [Cerioporus squamosus]|nr:hypothetical protein C8T65DRAFT_31471 [Cerioporus squamosus]